MSSTAVSSQALRLAAHRARTLPAARTGAELRACADVAQRRNLNVHATTAAGKLKTIDDLPGPSLSTNLYWLFVKGYADKSHLLQVRLFYSYLTNI